MLGNFFHFLCDLSFLPQITGTDIGWCMDMPSVYLSWEKYMDFTVFDYMVFRIAVIFTSSLVKIWIAFVKINLCVEVYSD